MVDIPAFHAYDDIACNYPDEATLNCRTHIVIGKRGSGKTVYIHNLLKKLADHGMMDICLYISPQAKTDPPKFADNVCSFDKYTDRFTDHLWNKYYDKYKVIIFDNFTLKTINHESLFGLMCHARVNRTTIIITMQYPISLSPRIRSQIDTINLLNNDYITSQKQIYDYYAGCIPKFALFKEILDIYTKDFAALVIRDGCNEPFDKRIHHYKPILDPGIIMKSELYDQVFDELTEILKNEERELTTGIHIVSCNKKKIDEWICKIEKYINKIKVNLK